MSAGFNSCNGDGFECCIKINSHKEQGGNKMNYWTQSKDNIWVAAHRGWRTKYPENTMEAFKAAMSLGVDQLETDIRVTKDGELVLIHDDTVDRTTNGTGKVCDYTLEEIKKLDAGSFLDPKFKDCRIPTFIEFMEYVKQFPAITLDLELKERPDNTDLKTSYDVCDKVLAIVDEYGFTDRVVINTWNGLLNEYIYKKHGKKYRIHTYYPERCLNGEKNPYELDPYSFAYCACMFDPEPIKELKKNAENMASKEEFAEMEAKGVQPWAGAGVKTEEGVDRAIAHGAYLITCDNPNVILDALRKKGKHK